MIDPTASIERANSISRWRGSGLCLDFVDWAMGRPGSRLGDAGGPPNGAWTEAKDGYYFSHLKHPGDEYPPAGVPCYWETGPSGNTAGHIVISLGGGWCRTTDYAGAASVSTQTIESITRARRGGYLGWTEDYGGNPIAGLATEVTAPPIPITLQKGTPTMRIIKNINTGRTYGIAPGIIKHHANGDERDLALLVEAQATPTELDNNQFLITLFNYGLEVAVNVDAKGVANIDAFNSLRAGHTTVAPWALEK